VGRHLLRCATATASAQPPLAPHRVRWPPPRPHAPPLPATATAPVPRSDRMTAHPASQATSIAHLFSSVSGFIGRRRRTIAPARRRPVTIPAPAPASMNRTEENQMPFYCPWKSPWSRSRGQALHRIRSRSTIRGSRTQLRSSAQRRAQNVADARDAAAAIARTATSSRAAGGESVTSIVIAPKKNRKTKKKKTKSAAVLHRGLRARRSRSSIASARFSGGSRTGATHGAAARRRLRSLRHRIQEAEQPLRSSRAFATTGASTSRVDRDRRRAAMPLRGAAGPAVVLRCSRPARLPLCDVSSVSCLLALRRCRQNP